MLIMGIETSCDETAVAVVRNGHEILSNVIFSQIELHRVTGGVVPEVAAREHVLKMPIVINQALAQADMKLIDIDIFAVTQGPGLLSSLLIGVNSAMTLAAIMNKPLVPINHIEGHMYANWIGNGKQEMGNSGQEVDKSRQITSIANDPAGAPITGNRVYGEPKFPIVVLTASGGHSELVLWKKHGIYRFLGSTLDDAAGEAFDKVARLLGLSYPGGPAIQKAALNGDATKYKLPRAWVTEWDFSFSGLKTAVLRLVNEYKKTHGIAELPAKFVADTAASFQESVCEVMATKLINAAIKFKAREVHLAGGVSANARLREMVKVLLQKKYPAACTNLADQNKPTSKLRKQISTVTHFPFPIPHFLFPVTSLCTDNAAMIAACGYFRYMKNPARFAKWRPIKADPNLPIKNWK